MEAIEILCNALKEMGADGLCNFECGCELDDLAPCGGEINGCVAAKKVSRDEASKLGVMGDEMDEWESEYYFVPLKGQAK